MSRMISVSVTAVALACASMAGAATMGPAQVVSEGHVRFFADGNGKTLYTFNKDSRDKSACTLLCAVYWPPLLAGAGSRPGGAWSLFERPSGAMQWAYKGAPLYTYRHDAAPGAITGNGVHGEWHLARP